MPHVTKVEARRRTRSTRWAEVVRVLPQPRADAFDPETGERYDDVIVIWVASEVDKQALVHGP